MFIGIGLLCLLGARAHDAGISVAQLQVRSETLELTVSYALKDVQRMLPPAVQLGTDSSVGTIENARQELEQLGELLWDVRVDGAPLLSRELKIEFTPSDNLAFCWVYPKTASGTVVLHSANLGSLPSTHREVFSVVDEKGRTRDEKMLDAKGAVARVSLVSLAGDPEVERRGETSSETQAGFSGFFKLGLEHIWTGYDHLLFLLGLLVVCRRFKSIVAIITCFTVAHSITLALATLDLASLPAWLVEPLIAASIVYVGVENFYLPEKEQARRGLLTFGFGLVHGFGFASVLRDLGVGSKGGGGIATPLLAFNLGVEIGQICVAAVVLPLLWWAFRAERVRVWSVRLVSGLVITAGLYWLIERTVLG